MEAPLVPQNPSIRECHARRPHSAFCGSPSQEPGNSPFPESRCMVKDPLQTAKCNPCHLQTEMAPGSIHGGLVGVFFPSRRSGLAGSGGHSSQSRQPVGFFLRAECSRDPPVAIGLDPPRGARQRLPLSSCLSLGLPVAGHILDCDWFRRIGHRSLCRDSALSTVVRRPIRHLDSRALRAVQLAASTPAIGTHAPGLFVAARGIGLHRAFDPRAGPSQPRAQSSGGSPRACVWRSDWHLRRSTYRNLVRYPARPTSAGGLITDVSSRGDRGKTAELIASSCHYEANLTTSP